ncbi:MAG TPA: hypothetical protein PKO36_13960 [Candidatus Hydrogenedentes bacterium]|nr:hypothetical protein [Candidatus Hydrogenedentota bacterium]HOV73837.1 hypothetical protein [Candidatus Hydrogenedentota bacterium]
MRARRILIGLLAVVLGFGGAAGIQRRLEAIHAQNRGDEMLYLPNEKILNHFCAGMDSIVAGFLWLKCVQYTAEHFHSDQDFTWLNHMADIITRLDPYNVQACRYLAIFLISLKADDNAGIELLKRGMAHNPFAYELPYEIAMTYLINRREQPDSPVQAAKYLGMAVETGHAPPFVLEVAQVLQGEYNLLDVERSMWMHALESGDPFMRELAERKLAELDLRVACAQLDGAIALYRQRHGQAPETIEDLVTGGILDQAPRDPLGGKFFIDALGRAQNTTVLDERVKRIRKNLQTAVESFQKRFLRFPAALDELVTEHIMDAIPSHPYAGRRWLYNPATGTVE